MKNTNLNRLTVTELEIFDKLAKAYAYNNIPIIMADYTPQRGGILSEFVASGGRAYMAGGSNGQQFFKNIPQFTTPYDTYLERDPNEIENIVATLPIGIVDDKFATFNYDAVGDMVWTKTVQKRLGGRVVAASEQSFREYFEEKTNLLDILKGAGLTQYAIPSTVIRNSKPLGDIQSQIMYNKFADASGRIVVQKCGEGMTEIGGGGSTEIVSTYEEFKEIVTADRPCFLKVSQFVAGSNSNLSLTVGNTVPSETMLGATKNQLLPDENRFTGEVLEPLQERARALGINESNIVVNVPPATLKVVGDPELTPGATNGVGNQLNYKFNPEILDTIYEIGQKLGIFMALCGKVGMCGLDLIITKEGQVYINELNDRQQGPTESASLNNEANGLPGILRESFILNYADLKKPEVVNYLTEMNERSREIYDASTQIPSPFYIKVCAKEDCFSMADLSAGDYSVTRDEQGEYTWNLEQDKKLEEMPSVDITEPETTVRINTCSAKEGDFVPEGSQLLRINGIATSETAPFEINEEGLSVLAESWLDPIRALYQQTLSTTQTANMNISSLTQPVEDQGFEQ